MAAPFLALGEPVKTVRSYKDRENLAPVVKVETPDEALFLRLQVASLDLDMLTKGRNN